MSFQAFVNDIKEHQWNVHGTELYRHGALTDSYGDTTESRYPIYSATKTILSIVVGIAWDEGKIDIGRCVLDYLPKDAIAGMPAGQKADFRKITIERLMTMSVGGFPFRPEGESYLRYSLNCPIADAGSREFNYSNISAYLVGVALTNAVGEDLYLYLTRRLFAPLHIESPVYTRCPDGYFYGASGMELTVRELSRIGLLLYNGGTYEGQRIVSEEYVARAASVQQINREGGYGYFIWKYRDGFSINGKWKQKCYILPKEKLMITYLSDIRDDSRDLLYSMEKNILGIS